MSAARIASRPDTALLANSRLAKVSDCGHGLTTFFLQRQLEVVLE